MRQQRDTGRHCDAGMLALQLVSGPWPQAPVEGYCAGPAMYDCVCISIY